MKILNFTKNVIVNTSTFKSRAYFSKDLHRALKTALNTTRSLHTQHLRHSPARFELPIPRVFRAGAGGLRHRLSQRQRYRRVAFQNVNSLIWYPARFELIISITRIKWTFPAVRSAAEWDPILEANENGSIKRSKARCEDGEREIASDLMQIPRLLLRFFGCKYVLGACLDCGNFHIFRDFWVFVGCRNVEIFIATFTCLVIFQ